MALDLENFPTAPFFVPKLTPVNSGVDYLNLRQVNLDLMAACIPGTNNVTQYIRPYSVICWAFWAHRETRRKRNENEFTQNEQRLYREKVESLHLWGHKLEGLQGSPGYDSTIPALTKGRVSLLFEDWKRTEANTSLIAAAQYGPSMGDIGGLAFFHRDTSGAYVLTEKGEALALSLDKSLRSSTFYEQLLSTSDLTGTEEMARDLFPFWRNDQTSQEEADVFRSNLWSPSNKNANTSLGCRSRIVDLISSTLEAIGKPVKAEAIRKSVALPELHTLGFEPREPSVEHHRKVWEFLQFRQLHRIAFESILSWVEYKILKDKSYSRKPSDLVKSALEELEDGFEFSRTDSVSKVFLSQNEAFFERSQIAKACVEVPDTFDPWEISERITKECRGDGTPLVSAFQGIRLLALIRPYLESSKAFSEWLDHGSSERVSISHLYALMERMADLPFEQFVDWVIKNLIISQHFAVGTQRFDGKRIRLRMYLDEDGLYPIIRRRWHPAVTRDRLDAFLSLLVCCKLLNVDESGHFWLRESDFKEKQVSS